MKSTSLFLLCFIVFTAKAQIDTASLRIEIEAVIKQNSDLINEGKYQESKGIILPVVEKCKEAFGAHSVLYGHVAFTAAESYYFTGDYSNAEIWYSLSREIREKTLGKENLDYFKSANNLAILYDNLGYYEKSEAIYLDLIKIALENREKEHMTYIYPLMNLGVVNYLMGNYEKAERVYQEVIPLAKKVFGAEHPNYSMALNGMGSVYFELGNHQKAEELHLQAHTIMENALGVDHPNNAFYLSNLAVLYVDLKQFEKADSLHALANEKFKSSFGADHPFYAQSLLNLAELNAQMGKVEKAKAYHLEAHGIWEKAQDIENPMYAQSLSSLAKLYQKIGDLEAAEPLFLKAESIIEKVYDKNHFDYVNNQLNLVHLYSEMEAEEKVQIALSNAYKTQNTLLEKATRHLPEKELTSYIQKFEEAQDLFFSLAQNQSQIASSSFDNLLFYKGFLLNASQKIKQLALSNTASTLLFSELKSYSRRLATEYAKPIAERTEIANLEEKVNALEKDLVREVAGYGETIQQTSWQEIQSKLSSEEAVIEFTKYNYFNQSWTDSVMYAAIILTADETPKMIPLFEESQLAALLQISKNRPWIGINKLYSYTENENSLYELIWKVLEKELSHAQTIYFSPAGILHRFNLGAIETPNRSSLGEKHDLVQLPSSRQLVFDPLTENQVQTATLFGGIKYDYDSLAMSLAFENINPNSVEATRGSVSFNDQNASRGNKWTYLEGSLEEVYANEKILETASFETTLNTGYEASEESFKGLGEIGASPKILHIATHGFFFPDPGAVGADGNREQSADSSDPVFKISENPMIRSGLVLAGGNYIWEGNTMIENREDGILTAYEISQMNLSNTELVVLSACETGLGDIEGNEGVYGLQRAFKIAGAKNLIMSLWQVPDLQTKELMSTFYSKWLEDNLSLSGAFQQAQEAIKKKYSNPYFWAGFILVQ